MKHRQYRRRGRHAPPRRRKHLTVASAALVVAASASGVLSQDVGHQPVLILDAATPTTTAATRANVDEASRAGARAVPSPAQSTSPPSAPQPRPPQPSTVPKPPSRPAPPVPVAGLNQAQMDNAAVIVQVGTRRGLPQRGLVVAVATALQESNLYNVASAVVPESLWYPHQGVGADFDSVGLFQQRPSQGWGGVAQLMDPVHSAGLFYAVLVQVPGWEWMSVSAAAQAVQRSAFPDAYQKHQDRAQQVVSSLTGR